MKIRPACAAVVSIGTALLLLAGIRCAQAAEIRVVSPHHTQTPRVQAVPESGRKLLGTKASPIVRNLTHCR